MTFDEPQSRNEAILQNLLGADNVLVDPESRIEAILQSILNETAYLEEPQSRMEELLLAVKNDETGWDAEALSRNEAIIIAWLNDEEYTEEPQSRIEELLIAWLASIPKYVLKTVVGKVLSITDAIEAPAEALSVEMLPIQDLHGYDSPWAGGAGVNKLDISTATPLSASYGLTKTIDSDGYVHLDGTVVGGGATLSVAMIKVSEAQTAELTGKGYIISAVDVSGGTVNSVWGLRDIDNGAIACSVPSAGEGTEIHMKFRFVVATTAQTAFTPYENICPITGTDAVDVVRTGKNVLNPILYDGGAYNPSVGSVWNLTVAPDARQFTDNHDGTFTYTTSSTWDYRTLLFPVKQSGERYNVSIQGASSGTLGRTVGYLDKNFTVLSRESTTSSSWTFETSLNPSADQDRAYFFIVITNRSTSVATITITNPSVVIDGDALPYEPYQSTTIPIEWGALGKNLLNCEVVAYTTTRANLVNKDDGTNLFSLKAGTYTFSNNGSNAYAYWRKEGTTDNNIIHTSGGTNYGTFTLTEDANYMFWLYGNGIDASEYTEIQLEKGSTKTAYEPFTKTVFGGHLDVVGGEIELDKISFTFNGTENWMKYGTPQSTWKRETWRCSALPYNIKARASSIADCLGSGEIALSNSSETASADDGKITCRPTAYESKVFYIFTPIEMAMTLEQVKQMLVDNPLQFVYPLAEPITIPIDPHTLTMLKNNNTIWSDANGDITLTYRAKAGD